MTAREIAPPDWGDLGRGYLWMTEQLGTVLVDVLRLLMEPNALPCVFHCAGGKDRTGIVAGLILAQLSVPDEFVTADCALTSTTRTNMPQHELDAAFRVLHQRGLPVRMMEAPPAALLRLLAELRIRYSSLRGYLVFHGADDDFLDRLEANLLEPV
jgi:protein-tyrosine phosphatase